MKKYQLTVTSREGTGRSASRRLRKAEKIPAILYGKHTKPENLAVNGPEFVKLRKEIGGKAALIELKRDAGATALSFLQEIQRDPITDKYLHLDLQEVKENEKMTINVSIHVTGEAYGVKTEGGILEFVLRQVEVQCLPSDIPEHIDLDVSALHLNQHLSVKDLPVRERVTIQDDPDSIVCVVAVPKEEAAPVVEEAVVEAAEPEVIKKGKETAGDEADAKKGEATKKAEPKKPEAKKA